MLESLLLSQSANLLLVDDNYGNLISLSALLEDLNATVHMAQSAEEGLALLQQQEIDIALLDVNMPGMNGLQMAKKMSANPRTAEIPVLFVTGHDADPTIMREGYETGAWDYICKPVDPLILSQKLKSFLAHVQYRRALKIANDELRSARAYYQTVLHTTAEGIVVINRHGVIEFINEPMSTMLQKNPRDLLGDSIFPYLTDDGDNKNDRRNLVDAIEARRSFQSHQMRLLVGPDKTIPIALSTNVLPDPQRGMVLSILDVSILRYMQSQLEKQAITDPLTGCLNRRGLMQAIDVALARVQRSHATLSVFYMDLDGFKRVNDSFGHDVGDELLKRVALKLRQSIRPYDTLARLGGDEFVALVECSDNIEQISRTAEKFIEAIALPQVLNGVNVNVGVSIGIACYPKCGDTVKDLMQAADIAMYQAKEAGKRQYRFFSAEMNGRARARLMLENSVRNAVDRNELRLFYQPQLWISTRKLRGFEALMRWQQPNVGTIEPGLFIPILEETGLIQNVGAWLYRTSVDQLLQWSTAHADPLCMSINISPLQFASAELIRDLSAVVQTLSATNSSLEVEVTESALIHNVSHAQQQLEQIRALGIRVALDDFGTGYSSLAYLREFPIDTVKIDRSFVMNMLNSKRDAVIVQTVIELGQRLEMEVIAEGVETMQQLVWLGELGCDIAQGYLFSRPKPAEEITLPFTPP